MAWRNIWPYYNSITSKLASIAFPGSPSAGSGARLPVRLAANSKYVAGVGYILSGRR